MSVLFSILLKKNLQAISDTQKDAILSHNLLLLLVWQAPLGVRSAKRRHQSPEWTILSHSYRLIQGQIVRPQVLLDSLHPCSTRMSWWFPPGLRRGSSYDTPGICLVWYSRNVAEQRKTPCLDNSRQAWLSIMWHNVRLKSKIMYLYCNKFGKCSRSIFRY